MTQGKAATAMAKVTAALPGSEERPGQLEMASAIEEALDQKRHLVVEAPTGVGKSLGYLVPAVLSGKRVVVTTATKALQDQLATKDLPFLKEHLGVDFDFAILKGRSNYICLQRLGEVNASKAGQLEIEELAPTTRLEVKRLAAWAATSPTGDQAELDWSPSERAWQSVSISSEECPGALRCPIGGSCFAELARNRAAAADVIVVNTHLYGLHVASGANQILPEHDVVIVDEAHSLEDVMSDTVGLQIGPGRFTRIGATVKQVVQDPDLVAKLLDCGPMLRDVLSPLVGQRLSRPLPSSVSQALVDGRMRLDTALEFLRSIATTVDDAKQRVLRSQQLIGRLIENIDLALSYGDTYVAFVGGGPEMPRLELAPLDVGPTLLEGIWTKRTAILTSATIPASLAERVGIPAASVSQISVDSPFDHEKNGLIYCALGLPDPRDAGYTAAIHTELEALITAAGGRTLALFTSYRAMDAAVEALKPRLPFKILSQRDLPKTALVKAFSEDEGACLFATSGFFQGVDIPGRTLSLVTIDRLPFPRPDDPLLSARRELLRQDAFKIIDLPRASMLLAQAAGRLIRTKTDRGVVAVFDKRLGTANYRWDIVKALPPMRRTRHRSEAEAFLREITAGTAPTPESVESPITEQTNAAAIKPKRARRVAPTPAAESPAPDSGQDD
jgi:ATP-dependent DNA helicase DinG